MGEKLRRFKLQGADLDEYLESFAARRLQETRYISVQAAEYLSQLYGGRADEDGQLRIQVNNGQTTAFFRDVWRLNGILNDGDVKTRDDHRHHAVDALVVALTDAGMVKRLSDAATHRVSGGRVLFGEVKPPWDGFTEEARAAVDGIVVSHRVRRKINGPLHEETNYSAPRTFEGKDYVHVRKPLAAMTDAEVKNIAESAVRQAVEAKLAELGLPPKKAFQDEANHPCLIATTARLC